MAAVVLARVVTSIPGAGLCRVQGTGFDAWAIYNGQGSTGLGIREGGGLAPGTVVVVKLGTGVYPGIVLATMRPPTDLNVDNFKPFLISDPQVAGYRAGSLFRDLIGSQTWRTDEYRLDTFADLVAGEWSKHSPFGPFVNVEFFRAAMGASEMASLEFFGDTSAARLRGLELDIETLSREEHIRRNWNSMEHTVRDWWTTTEAVDPQALPRHLSIGGPLHVGTQRFLAPAGQKGTPRAALFHEYLGSDGTHITSTAGALILQRCVDLDVPEEIAPVDPPTYEAEVAAALVAPREAPVVTGSIEAVTHAQASWDIIDGTLRFLGRNGVEGVPQQWSPGTAPLQDAAPIFTAQMWQDLPKVVEIVVEPEGQAKKFFVGKSTFALLPDGSVLVEDASGSQILMAGGNIVLSAPGDIIAHSGGSTQVIAGRSAVIRADGHVDVVSNSGRVNLKAEKQLSLLGGNDGGAEGVLIESRSVTTESKAGVGLQGSIAGLTLKSASGIFAAAQGEIGLGTPGNVTVAAGVFQADTESVSFRIKGSLQVITATRQVPMLQIGAEGTSWLHGSLAIDGSAVLTGSLTVTQDILSAASIYAAANVAATSVVSASDAGSKQSLASQVTAATRATTAALAPFKTAAMAWNSYLETALNREVPLVWTKAARLGFSFPGSAEIGVQGYGLPEMRWQQASGGPQWVENVVGDPSGTQKTMAYPGYDAWFKTGKYFVAPAAKFFDPVTYRFTPSQPDDATPNEIAAAASEPLLAFVRSPI